MSNSLCKSTSDSANKMVSSKYNKTNNFTYIYKSSLNWEAIVGTPITIFNSEYSSRLFKKKENKNGDKFSTWLTPLLHGKISEMLPFDTILVCIPL